MHKLAVKGPYTNDVSREGVGQYLARGREVAWIWYWQGGGIKNPENLADVICERPLILYRVGTHAIALFHKKKRTCLIGTRCYAQLEVDWGKERGSIKSTGYFTDAVVFNFRGRGDGKSPFQEMRSVSTAVNLESWFLSEEGRMEMERKGLTDYDWDTLRAMRIGMR